MPDDGFAVLYKGKRLIVLGSNNDSTTLRHGLLLGHELGHHICGHSIGIAWENNWAKELEADRYAGVALRTYIDSDDRNQLYLGEDDIETAVKDTFGHNLFGNATHPPVAQRLAAIMNGYRTGTSPCLKRLVALPSDATAADIQADKVERLKRLCEPIAGHDPCEADKGLSMKERYERHFMDKW